MNASILQGSDAVKAASGPVDESPAASNTSGSDSDAPAPGEPGDRNTVAQTDAGTIKNGPYRIKVEIPILRDTSIDAETSDALRPQMADAINSNPDWNFCITDKQTVQGDWTELMMKIGADQLATCIKPLASRRATPRRLKLSKRQWNALSLHPRTGV